MAKNIPYSILRIIFLSIVLQKYSYEYFKIKLGGKIFLVYVWNNILEL